MLIKHCLVSVFCLNRVNWGFVILGRLELRRLCPISSKSGVFLRERLCEFNEAKTRTCSLDLGSINQEKYGTKFLKRLMASKEKKKVRKKHQKNLLLAQPIILVMALMKMVKERGTLINFGYQAFNAK